MDKLQDLVDADYAAGDDKRSLETDAAILALMSQSVPQSVLAAVEAALKLKPKYTLRDHAKTEAANLAAQLRLSTEDDMEACRLARAKMAGRGWKFKSEQIHRAEFERKDQAVNAIRAARKIE